MIDLQSIGCHKHLVLLQTAVLCWLISNLSNEQAKQFHIIPGSGK